MIRISTLLPKLSFAVANVIYLHYDSSTPDIWILSLSLLIVGYFWKRIDNALENYRFYLFFIMLTCVCCVITAISVTSIAFLFLALISFVSGYFERIFEET